MDCNKKRHRKFYGGYSQSGSQAFKYSFSSIGSGHYVNVLLLDQARHIDKQIAPRPYSEWLKSQCFATTCILEMMVSRAYLLYNGRPSQKCCMKNQPLPRWLSPVRRISGSPPFMYRLSNLSLISLKSLSVIFQSPLGKRRNS